MAYKWWVVAMLWFVCLFNYADRQAIFSVFPLLKQEMNLSDVQLGVVGSAFMWVYAFGAPLAGMIGDRFNRKALILGGLIFWSVVTVATALSTSYWQLVLCRALEGLGETFYFPASMSMLSDYHGKETRSRAMGMHQSSVYAGTILGGALSGYMGQHFGWRSSFVLFGSLGTVLGFVLLLLLKEPQRTKSEETVEAAAPAGGIAATLKGIFASPMAPVLMTIFVGANFVAMVFLTWMPSFLFRKFNLTLTMAGLSGTAYLQIASVLGVLTGGVLADKLVRKHPGGRMIAQCIGLAGGIPFLFLTGWTVTVPTVVPGHGRLRLLQGPLRRQHLGLPLRCRQARAPRQRRRPHELRRLARRERRANRGGGGFGPLRHERSHQRDLPHLPRARHSLLLGHPHLHAPQGPGLTATRRRGGLRILRALSYAFRATLRLIVVPERKILLWLISSFFATQGQCRLPGCSSLQGFGITSVGAGIPPLRISASGTPMPPRSGSSGGMRLVPETNSQKLSEPGLYYKTFAGTKPAPPERSLAHV